MMHSAMDLATCLFVNLVCQRKLPAKTHPFTPCGMQSTINLSPACLLVDFVAMLVACATSVLIGAVVGPVTGSLKHL